MTLEEAKKILEKEGFKLGGPGKPGVVSEAFAEYEAPEICEAMQIVCSAGFQLAMLAGVFDERKERLKKEYEKNTKAPDSAKNCIKEDSVVINPALKESASQFNDALLDEQAKKIEELTKDKELMKKASLSQLDDFIEIYNLLTKESQKVKRLGKEIAKLNGIIHGKNAVLSDVAEELRLTKIREKNLVEVSQKYMKEIEELNEKAKSVNMHRHKELAEKDEVIADLTHELKAKHKKYVWYKGAYDAAQQILNTIADYAVKHPDKKFSDQMVEENHPIEGDPVRNSGENEMEEHVKRLCKARKKCHRYRVSCDNAEEGADLSGVIVLCGKDFIDALKKVKDVWQE